MWLTNDVRNDKQSQRWLNVLLRKVEGMYFVRYGKISGIQIYFGDKDAECDRSVIENAVRDYKDIPAGCSLDFGVTDDGRTLLIEMNDGLALGCYGLPDEEYAKLPMARWAELNGTKDPFRNC